MFQRFSQEALRAVVAAQAEARELDSGEVQTEHLLLALLQEPETEVAQRLQAAGVTRGRMLETLAAQHTGAVAPGPEQSAPFSTGVKKTLEIAGHRSTLRDDAEVEPADLLAGVLEVDADRLGLQGLAAG